MLPAPAARLRVARARENNTVRRLWKLLAARTQLVGLPAAVAIACAWDPYVPKTIDREVKVVPQRTETLALGRTEHLELDCPAGQCQARFRIDVDRAGELRIEITPSEEADNVSVRAFLEDRIGGVLDRAALTDETPVLRLRGSVDVGPHFVLVQSVGGRVPYSVVAHLGGGAGREPAIAQPPTRREQQSTAGRYLGAGSPSSGFDAAYDPDVAFAAYRRYAFAQDPEKRLEKEHPGAPVGNPFVERQIQRAIRYALDRKGVVLAADGATPDFLVAVQVGTSLHTWYSIGGDLVAEPYATYFDAWGFRRASFATNSSTRGALVIDFVDAQSGKLVWHGWASEGLPPDKSGEEIIQTFVDKILANFPPAS